MAEMKRAYAQFNIKSFDEEQRTIKGIATTPKTDHQDDIVEPRGASYELPIPFLFAHDSKQPIGQVQKAVVTDAGIEIEAQIKKIPEPGRLKDRVDEAWQSIKYGLVRGLSIGFKDVESEPIKGSTWGRRIKKWSWLELSAVVIAANSEASITAIKEIDSYYRTASGHKAESAGVSASHSLKLEVRHMPMTNADRMKGLEEKRAAEVAARESIQEKVTEENRSKDDDEQQKFDDHSTSIKSIDRELSDCRLIERELIAKAKPVNPDNGNIEFHSPIIQVTTPKLEPGIALMKQLACVLHASQNHRDVYAVAREYCGQWPQIENALRQKAAVAVGTTTGTTWAAPLVYAQNLVAEFVNLLWPMSVMGRLQGLRRVGFNSRIPRETSVIAAEWVGEGRAKPVGALAFDTVTLTFAKCALIIGITDELARFSNPNAEILARDTLAEGITKFVDEQFLSANAAVTNVSPAGILNSADTDTASGTDATAVIHDMRQILAHYQVYNIPVNGLALVMQPVLASAIASLYTTLGVPYFPNISGDGGSVLGLQIITSNNVPSGYIISMHPPSVAVADEGGLQIDVSREASVELEDNPTTSAYHLLSAFQANLIFVRAERYITWARLRTKGVFYLTSAAYGGSITT